ncbi:DNA transposition protein |uniref:DNA transposition protein \|nr:AAA family ATPase [Sulfuriferula multivorans]GBL46465.1 DNA transposition protein \
MLSEIDDPIKQEIDLERWERLKNRMIDEISNGFTLERIANEAGPAFVAGHLEKWAANPEWWRDGSRGRIGDQSMADKIESVLETYFAGLDADRMEEKKRNPGRVETSVMQSVFKGFKMARRVPAMVDICVPAGAGKTQALDEYINRCRKEEGLDCPVWSVGLSEFGLTTRAVLSMIAANVDSQYRHDKSRNDFEIDFHIEEKTRGLGGILIIDEAQHLADAKLEHGIRIVNGLRRYVDKGLFGIALLNNGEVYRRISGGKHDQLLSRMKEWRVEVKSVTEHDIDLVMAAWGVSGKEEREWCVERGTGPGQLRAMVSGFKRSLLDFDVIDISTLRGW